jgi:hypothetical protein
VAHVVPGEPEIDPDRVDHLLATGVHEPVADIAAAQARSGQQAVDN